LRSLLDADGDGTYKLVVRSSLVDPVGSHEGWWVALMKLEENTWRQVLSEGCGD
jgi:hypothetical protein